MKIISNDVSARRRHLFLLLLHTLTHSAGIWIHTHIYTHKITFKERERERKRERLKERERERERRTIFFYREYFLNSDKSV